MDGGRAVGPFFKGGYLTRSILEKYSFRNSFKLAPREARKLQYSYCTLCEVKNWASRTDGVTGKEVRYVLNFHVVIGHSSYERLET